MTLPAPRRVLSIDVLRGITIAFMILVNDPGDWGHVYGQLDHAPWNGLTLTDLVFPTFLFLMGASLIYSIAARQASGNCRLTLTGHIFRRAAILFALDLALSGFPEYQLAHMRIYGVLTRIALCYLCAGLILLATRRVAALTAICAALLVGLLGAAALCAGARLRRADPRHPLPRSGAQSRLLDRPRLQRVYAALAAYRRALPPDARSRGSPEHAAGDRHDAAGIDRGAVPALGPTRPRRSAMGWLWRASPG